MWSVRFSYCNSCRLQSFWQQYSMYSYFLDEHAVTRYTLEGSSCQRRIDHGIVPVFMPYSLELISPGYQPMYRVFLSNQTWTDPGPGDPGPLPRLIYYGPLRATAIPKLLPSIRGAMEARRRLVAAAVALPAQSLQPGCAR